MASIKAGSLRLVVYSDDHPPPHAHVLGPGWEIRVELASPPSLMTIAGAAKKQDARNALMAVNLHLEDLKALWSTSHG
jgi:Domain of unknown function (DUF4160)